MKLTDTEPSALALRQAQDQGYWKLRAFFKRETRTQKYTPYVALPLF